MSSPLNHAQSHLEGANRAYAAGDYQTALALADKAIAANPNNSDALHRRGLTVLALGAPTDAQVWLARAVQLLPHPVYCNSLCVTQTRLRDYAAAAETARLGLRCARERFPAADTSLLSYNLGVVLQLADQPAEAAQSYRQTLARQPDHAAAHNNLGTVTKDLGDLATAITHFERAVALDARNVEAHSNLGHALLAAGRYAEGWPHFEQRWASDQVGERPAEKGAPALPIAQWRSGPLPGERRLLVLHEQGFGDALQFCRYLPIALAHGTPADRRRSIAPDAFAKLLSWRGAHWISLQKADDASKQLPPAYRGQVTDWMDEIGDFADTAALIDGLDLVIAVDTSVAHLAAAMGKRVWLLNRFAGCWRWLRDRDDSPWYPGLRLFTQTERGNWDEVLDRVLHALAT